ncbi:nucleotide kinase domain-containing protein [Sphingobacterium sp.]|uniref:nucleotide kinase domain-containing protein n=1 Tax=Sphingobacterium sp. TaxID=341027 RepID=UPI0028A804D3|nr:nucleotide kinase domain-containing protein [Sphingobacterium sp.]
MGISHYVKLTRPKRSSVYDLYWIFANKRQEIFEKRLIGQPAPWTDDHVINNHRFTNVFRASDRVSQYLIDLQYQGENIEEVFFKTMLFKIFNKIETYKYLETHVERISVNTFSTSSYDKLLTARMMDKKTIYSAAYIMPSAGNVFGYKLKHSNHLALLSRMIKEKTYLKIQRSKSLQDVYKIILSYPSFGSFLAYQYTIDLNYSQLINFSEMDFVVAGPGAKNGILKCFDSIGSYSFEDVIKLMTDDQELECERLNLKPPNLWGRRLQLIDCQNIFCEVDKYLRGTNPELSTASGRTKIKQKFTNPKGTQKFFFPPKWNINHKIQKSCQKKENADIFL